MTNYASYSTDLQNLSREFMLTSAEGGWDSSNFKAYAQTLDRIAYELLIEAAAQPSKILSPWFRPNLRRVDRRSRLP
jgi:hypothetical protein